MRATRGPADMRAGNRALVLDLVRRTGPLSRADVAKRSGLTKPTASGIMEELVRDGVVFEQGTVPAGPVGGRPPVLYRFNPRAWFVVGIDVKVSRTTVVVADATGTEVARAAMRTRRRAGDAFRAVGTRLHELLDEHDIELDDVTGCAVSIAGLVDPSTGVCVLAPNLGWRDVDVPALLAPHLPVEPEVHNVLQAVLYAEHLEGAAKDVDDAVLLVEADGVGAALLFGGQIHRGPGGLAGEIGHAKLPDGTLPCGCGGTGCLETLLTRSAILRQAGCVASLSALAASDDPAAHALLGSLGGQLGHAAGWIVSLLNPELVLLSGGFVECGPRFLDAVATTLRREVLPELARTVDVRHAALGDHAAVRGAILLALRATERSASPAG
jgi:predicted NBD/HSP70 family sugar kinase